MRSAFEGWKAVAAWLERRASEKGDYFNAGQRATLRAMAERLPRNGVILADEVGMGKTRIAVAVARSVIECGGRVAVLVPPGLGFQWRDEFLKGGQQAPALLRSFRQYLEAWGPSEPRFQTPWFQHSLVLLSHAFANWRLGEGSESWRWALLPTLYGEWRKEVDGRYPRNFRTEDRLDDDWVRNAARSICAAIDDMPPAARHAIDGIYKDTPWPGALVAAEYSRNGTLRPLLQQAVGLGLGPFDLIVVDEAHKSRGSDSGLSRLLERIIIASDDARRLGMTATPVELDVEQWLHTLARIGISNAQQEQAANAISRYAEAVRAVRQTWRTNAEVREAYKNAAINFHRALERYVLRRGKDEDDAVVAFRGRFKESLDAYRREQELAIEPDSLALPWQRAICGAESLSQVASQWNDLAAKRLRLTLGNGHGIASLLDESRRDSEADRKQEEHDGILASREQAESQDQSESKRRARIEWWKHVIALAVGGQETLYEHPAIVRATSAIEDYTARDEKVLVFGRFTQPLRDLTHLLNAREMLRRLQDGRPWPQSRVHEDHQAAVSVAHRQLQCRIPLDEINSRLDAQYKELESRREHLRNRVADYVADGLRHSREDAGAFLPVLRAMSEGPVKALLARALDELLGSPASASPDQYARAFVSLIAALRDRDEGDTDGDGRLDAGEAEQLWPILRERLHQEYGAQQGTFARLMYGGTEPEVRRILQLAFNRRSSFPRVLVAQSLVGREGLNLHEACRVVVLLHPEWNPGVVEQQIGRVDRVGSWWSQLLAEAIKNKSDAPRIEIHPVIFRGTYDEYHWKVLRERWDDLRAQLHGIVVPQRLRRRSDPAESQLIRELDAAAPVFSPLKHALRN
jgi:hypothetical protein